MLVLDDILLSPLKGIMFLAQEIQKAAEEKSASEEQALRTELTELYMMLETGKITEEEFDARERTCLDLLDVMESRNRHSEEQLQTGGPGNEWGS